MARSNVPFLEDESTDIALSKAEFVEEKRKKKRTSNKIFMSYVEPFVQEMLIEGKNYSEIIETLKKDSGFTVGYGTLKDYDEFYFKDLENKAVQRVKDKLLHHIDTDEKTIDALYDKCATIIEYKHKEFDRIRDEIHAYRTELEEENEDGSPKLSQMEKIKMRDVIHEREKTLSGIRAEIAEKLEGPQGFVIKTQEIARQVYEGVLKIVLPEIPKEKLSTIRPRLGDFMRRYDEI